MVSRRTKDSKRPEVRVGPVRRHVNAAIIPIATMLALRALFASDAHTRGVLETLGVVAAITTATFVALWHLTAAGRSIRPAFLLCGALVLSALGTVASVYSIGRRPDRFVEWIAYPTLAIMVGAFALAVTISVLGLRPTGEKR